MNLRYEYLNERTSTFNIDVQILTIIMLQVPRTWLHSVISEHVATPLPPPPATFSDIELQYLVHRSCMPPPPSHYFERVLVQIVPKTLNQVFVTLTCNFHSLIFTVISILISFRSL